MLAWMAMGLLSTLAAMTAPYSVKTYGGFRRPSWLALDVAFSRHQECKLLLFKLIREILREAIEVPSYLLIQPCRRYAVDGGQIGVENHSLSANCQDCLLDLLDGNQRMLLRHRDAPVKCTPSR